MGFSVRDLLPILFCGLSIPLSLFMWLGNVTISKFLTPQFEGKPNIIPPTRWLFSILVSLAFMLFALKRRSVNGSGAALGLIVAILLSIASHAFFFSLAAFFFTSSRATKFRSQIKKKIEEDFKEGGQRNWVQVLCNGGMAAQLALLYLIDVGSNERYIDFDLNYRASWLGIAILSAIACCSGDTWASELGSVLSSRDPFLITTFKRVPRGTNGGVSGIGLILSFLGGTVVGLAYYVTICLTATDDPLLYKPPQWPLILCGGISGLLGSLIDSLLGATLQYSAIDANGKIVDHPGEGVRHISGLRIIDNHSVNLISSIITGICMPALANKYWPEN